MQEQTGPGWNLVWSECILDWSAPQPIETLQDEDYAPRVMTDIFRSRVHAVWQRRTGTDAEIMHGEQRYGGGWSVEQVTSNDSEDLSPDIAARFDEHLHVTWVGYDTQSGEGKIFYARKAVSAPGPWTVEMLSESELGPFWTGAAPKIDLSEYEDIVHIVYRGGDFGQYHTHYARRDPSGVWSYRILMSPNQEDLVADVTGRSPFVSDVAVFMSGNDCFGCPSRIYVRRSFDGGLTFGNPELVSGVRSAELACATGGSVDVAAVASVLSGNILTGELILSRELERFTPVTLPPENLSSSWPSAYQTTCVGMQQLTYFGLGILFTNRGGELAPADSAEVWAIRGHEPGLAVEDVSPAAGAGLTVTALPNPFDRSTVISASSVSPGRPIVLSIYDSLGRLVQRFGDEAPASRFTWSWDGRDQSGKALPAGVFFVETRQGALKASQQLILIR